MVLMLPVDHIGKYVIHGAQHGAKVVILESLVEKACAESPRKYGVELLKIRSQLKRQN